MGSGFGRTNWPRQRRIFSVCEMPPVRALGNKLFPAVEADCCSLAPLPPQLDSLPGTIQDAVKKGVQIALRDAPPLNVSAAPNEKPPFRSAPLNKTLALIVGGPDTSFQAILIDEGLRGSTGILPDGATFPIVIVNPNNFASPQDIVPFLVLLGLDYERLHISGVDAIPSSLDAYLSLAFTVTVNGETVLDRASLLALREFSLDAPPRSRVVFYVANRDAQSAFLTYFTCKGWSYICEGQGNFLSQTTLRQDGQWEEPNAPCIPPQRRVGAINGGCK